MITYMYWFAIILILSFSTYICAYKYRNIKLAAILFFIIFLIGWSTYYFRLQQVFVKRYGGVMTISVPAGQHHLGATWKDDNLWIENYDPKANLCIFSEYSKGNMLQGRVTIKNCNPLLPTSQK